MKLRMLERRHGFTAVELLISTAVAVILMLIVGVAFSNVTTAVGAGNARSDVFNKTRLVYTTLKNDLEGLYRDRTIGQAGVFDTIMIYDEAYTSGTDNRSSHTLQEVQAPTTESFYHMRMRFCTTTALASTGDDMACLVEYALLSEPSGGGSPTTVPANADLGQLHLYRVVRKLSDVKASIVSGAADPIGATAPVEVEVLATHVAGFDVFWYADGSTSGNVSPASWTTLPVLLRVRLDVADPLNQVQEVNGGYPMTFVQEYNLNTDHLTVTEDGI